MLRPPRYHCRSLITPMPCIGASGPVDIHGTVVLGTAEIVGGLILSMIMDPEAPLLGYIACNQFGYAFRHGHLLHAADGARGRGRLPVDGPRFGGGTAVGGRSYINARRPGCRPCSSVSQGRWLRRTGGWQALGYAATVASTTAA